MPKAPTVPDPDAWVSTQKRVDVVAWHDTVPAELWEQLGTAKAGARWLLKWWRTEVAAVYGDEPWVTDATYSKIDRARRAWRDTHGS